MDQRSNRLGTTTKLRAVEPRENPGPEVTRLRSDIEDARDGLGVYVSELDRRRHDAFDLKGQLKKHKALLGIVTIAAAASLVARAVRSRRNPLQHLPWSPWRAPAVAQKSGFLKRLVLSAAVPVALKAARGVAERTASRRVRLA